MGDGAENTSGIQHVSLIYKYKENEDDSFDEDWKYYQNKSAAIYSWVFGRISGDTMPSGYYKLSTRAKDWAGNLQDIDTTRDDTITSTFLFDDIDPEINTAFESSYTYKELPNMNLNISDDFMLDSFGYRLDDETKWTWIKQSGINAETYSVDWVLSESKWTSWDEGETHHIYFIVTDEAGNVYEDNPLKITKENMDDFFIDLSNFAEFHLDKEVTIHAAVPDYLNIKSVQLLYSFSEDNSNWDEYTQVGENLTSIPYSWKFEPSKGDGYYRFRTKITTVEGNIFITDEDVNYTSVPTTLFVVLMLMTTILLFVTAIVLYRIKSKK